MSLNNRRYWWLLMVKNQHIGATTLTLPSLFNDLWLQKLWNTLNYSTTVRNRCNSYFSSPKTNDKSLGWTTVWNFRKKWKSVFLIKIKGFSKSSESINIRSTNFTYLMIAARLISPGFFIQLKKSIQILRQKRAKFGFKDLSKHLQKKELILKQRHRKYRQSVKPNPQQTRKWTVQDIYFNLNSGVWCNKEERTEMGKEKDYRSYL